MDQDFDKLKDVIDAANVTSLRGLAQVLLEYEETLDCSETGEEDTNISYTMSVEGMKIKGKGFSYFCALMEYLIHVQVPGCCRHEEDINNLETFYRLGRASYASHPEYLVSFKIKQDTLDGFDIKVEGPGFDGRIWF